MKKLFLAVMISLLLPLSAYATPVDLELALLVDVSGSVSTSEYNLQKTGYVNAFNNASIVNAITGGTIGSIAVSYIEWSSSSQQSLQVNWTKIDSAASASAFASAINGTSRAFSGGTQPSFAINYALGLFSADNGFEGTREVIDVSGDGTGNSTSTDAARDAAELAGVSINGIAIGGSSIEQWYNDHIKTSDGFVVFASNFSDFENGILKKLETEISGGTTVPEPSTAILLGIGILGLAGISRKKQS